MSATRSAMWHALHWPPLRHPLFAGTRRALTLMHPTSCELWSWPMSTRFTPAALAVGAGLCPSCATQLPEHGRLLHPACDAFLYFNT